MFKKTNKLRAAGLIFALGALSISGPSSAAKIEDAGVPLPAGDGQTCTTKVCGSVPAGEEPILCTVCVPVLSGSIFYPVSTYSYPTSSSYTSFAR